MIDEALTTTLSTVAPASMLQNADGESFPCIVFDIKTEEKRIAKDISEFTTESGVVIFSPSISECRTLGTAMIAVVAAMAGQTINNTHITAVKVGQREPDLVELEGNNPCYIETVNFTLTHKTQ